jgi:hypothetical protein
MFSEALKFVNIFSHYIHALVGYKAVCGHQRRNFLRTKFSHANGQRVLTDVLCVCLWQ